MRETPFGLQYPLSSFVAHDARLTRLKVWHETAPDPCLDKRQ